MKRQPNTLAIRVGKSAKLTLIEFVNLNSSGFEKFRDRWEKRFAVDGLRWAGGREQFEWTQGIVRQVWKGQKKGLESFQVKLALGFPAGRGEVVESLPPIEVDWENGSLILLPRSINDLIWLTLLQLSQQLAVCRYAGISCHTPYYIRGKKHQRVCSDACAITAQQEYKRQWWERNGPEWRKKRAKRSRITGSNHQDKKKES